MDSFDFPRYKKNQKTGCIGEAFFENFVTKTLGCFYRKVHREHDFGIDGYIDLVDGDFVTGRSIAVQIKCGDSYMSRTTCGGVKYLGENKHLNYLINLSIPVILVVINSECTKGYWVQFTVGATNPQSSAWWIEVPFSNPLNQSMAPKLFDITGAPQDFSEEIRLSWEINSTMDKAEKITLVVSKEEIEEIDMSGILDLMERHFRTNSLLISNRNKVQLWFLGYDEDPRELYEIQEVRNWFLHSIKRGIPWFYILDETEESLSLPIFMFASCGTQVYTRSDGAKGAMISNYSEISRWVHNNFESLNKFADEKQLPEWILEDVSNRLSDSVKKLISATTT